MENKIIRFWVDHSLRDFHVALGVLAVFIQVIGRISNHTNLFAVADLIGLFTILHFFVHGYFHKQQEFLSNHQRVYALPKKKIRRLGGFFLVGFVLCMGIGMTIVKELYSGTLYAKLKAMIFYILANVFGMAFESGGLGNDKLIHQKIDLLGTMNQVSARSEAPWENLMNYIQTILIIVGLVLVLLLGIFYVANSIKKLVVGTGFASKKRVAKDVTDYEEALQKQTSSRVGLFDSSPNAKLRRLYKKRVQKHKKKGQVISEWFTPSEIEKSIGWETSNELHNLYEKARYSKEGCTKEDIQRAKDL